MEMEQVIELVKGVAKEGTDFAPIEKALSTLNPLAEIKSKEDAWKVIKSNDLLLSTMDSKVGERVKSAEKTLMDGKVSEMLKEREAEIRAELNPKETAEQKRLRELEGQLSERDKKEAYRQLQDSLSEKAKELGFDAVKARELAVYGDEAENKLSEWSEFINSTVENKINSNAKEKFSQSAPKVKVPSDGLQSLSQGDLNNLAKDKPEMKPAIIAEIKRRTRPT